MSEEELYRARLSKLQALQTKGVDAWPVRFDRTHVAAELHDTYNDLEAGAESGANVRVAGRLMSSRTQGKVAFGDLVDASGKIQLFVAPEGVEAFDSFDSGDVIGASGEVIRTKRGELSVRTTDIVLLAKALRPLPDKWHGLQDVEVRFRQRYLDLIANPDARRIAELRIETLRTTRNFLDARGFNEVETPVLHPIPGGAAAEPFVTHFNAISNDMYLRVATELYLKRLIVGGLERVYEIGRTFRNEGLSYKYNPEFTMLEAYQAYADYGDMMELVQSLVQDVAQQTIGGTKTSFRGHDIDLGGRWPRVTMIDLVSKATGTKIDLDTPVTDLRETCARFDVEVQPWWGAGMLIGELHDKVAEKTIVEPTIVQDYPLDISPLARRHRDDPRLTERFEPIVCGMEIGNAFSELNDPIDQRVRFEAQMEAREHGDLEANPIDEPYIRALEYGMPPTGGLGVGIDRVVMVLAGVQSIREVILFPALRPETADEESDDPNGG
ncbi:MAG TPA: lysine--tRNA ligase [Actinomycetota bacterium]|jgi:lysyl-tRNA synthetase class 2|nr:lysine--tRNA ligase [Actinomycetota bacterium]